MRTLSRVLFLLVCLQLVGCGSKVHDDLNGEVSALQDLVYHVDGPKKAQKIRIVVAADENVNVFVLLKKDFSDITSSTLTGANVKTKLPETMLSKSFDAKTYDLQVDVPAKEELTIVIASKKPTKVNVKVDSQ